jgi:pilus assembly protein Flp/PilA
LVRSAAIASIHPNVVNIRFGTPIKQFSTTFFQTSAIKKKSVSAKRNQTSGAASFEKGCMMKLLNRLIQDESGATAIEYGLIVALISVAAIAAMSGMGDQLQATFNTTSSAMATP